jgi:hypothetical protein
MFDSYGVFAGGILATAYYHPPKSVGSAMKIAGWGTLHATLLFASAAHGIFSVDGHFKKHFPLRSPTYTNTSLQRTVDKAFCLSIAAITALALTIGEKICRSGSSMPLTFKEATVGFATSIFLLFLGDKIDRIYRLAAQPPGHPGQIFTSPMYAIRTIL